MRDRSLSVPIALSVVGSLAAFVVIAMGSWWTSNAAALDEAKREAGRFGEVTARVAVAPYLTPGLIEMHPDDLARLDAVAAQFMTSGAITRVKIWSEAGRVVWSDDPGVRGETFELEADERALFATQGSKVSVSDLTKSENAGEVAAGSSRLLEVYFGAKTSDGQRVLVETYYPYSLVEDRAAELRSRFTPLSIAALALLALAQVPLAIMLGRRLTRSRRERERLLERVISASDAERRRIAAEVHDGAVQDLIGISFSLEATADAAPAPIDESLHQLAGSTRTTVRRLRSLLSSIYPVEVPETGWASGLEDLVDALEESGVRVEQQIDPVRLTPFDELLLLRVARESLRNVDAHASAENVTVRLYERLGRVVLEVRDDGRGFSDANEVSSRREGHLGLQLLRDLATDVGATLDVDSDSGRGTTLRLELVGPR